MSVQNATSKRIAKLRERYFTAAVGKQSLLALINEAEVADQVYNSNAIENSTLSLEETEKILQQIDLDRYISEREIHEAKNLARVVSYLDKKAKEKDLDLDVMLTLHHMLIGNIRDEIAGRFRKHDEWVRVGTYIAVDPKEVESRLQKMLVNYQASTQESVVKRMAQFHLDFEAIHPFVDGNGRIGRVLNNYLLIREGYVPINIKFVDRKTYYEAFREFEVTKATGLMEDILEKSILQSYHKRLAYLEGKKIVTLKEFASAQKMSHSNAINKAHRQTIEAFQEKGIWKIGV